MSVAPLNGSRFPDPFAMAERHLISRLHRELLPGRLCPGDGTTEASWAPRLRVAQSSTGRNHGQDQRVHASQGQCGRWAGPLPHHLAMRNKENWTVRGGQQRHLERLCPILVHTSATRFETALTDLRAASCQVPAKSFALPADHSVGSDLHQGSPPAIPQQEEPGPEQAVGGGRNEASLFSPAGGELKTKSIILHRGGRLSAKEEPRETKHEPDEGRDQSQFLVYIVMKFKLPWADAVLANGAARSASEHYSRGSMSILQDPSAPCRHSAHLTLSGYVSFDPTDALSVTFKTKQFAREIVRIRACTELCLRLFSQAGNKYARHCRNGRETLYEEETVDSDASVSGGHGLVVPACIAARR